MSRRYSGKAAVVVEQESGEAVLPRTEHNSLFDSTVHKSDGKSLGKKVSTEEAMFSTPDCIAGTVTVTCTPDTLSRSSSFFATPTLPQGASSSRKQTLNRSDVKRRLDLECVPSSSGFKTPKAKQRRTLSTSTSLSHAASSPRRSETPTNGERSRFDSSLGILTKRFLDLIRSAEGGVLDLNQASVALAVQKRRIYDITNVLEGIGLLEKISKNNIQWRGDQSDSSLHQVQQNLTNELRDLEAKENQLDQLISNAELQLHLFNEEKTYAYVTYADLKSISGFRDKTIMAIRAPPETKLEVPDPSESENRKTYQLYIKTESGEIDVFLCPEDDSSSSESASPGSPTKSPHGSRLNRAAKDKSELVSGKKRCKGKGTNRQLLFEDEVLGGQLTTEDQDQVKQEETGIDISSMATLSENFLPLEPPLSETDYTFTMADGEGLADLFDFSF